MLFAEGGKEAWLNSVPWCPVFPSREGWGVAAARGAVGRLAGRSLWGRTGQPKSFGLEGPETCRQSVSTWRVPVRQGQSHLSQAPGIPANLGRARVCPRQRLLHSPPSGIPRRGATSWSEGYVVSVASERGELEDSDNRWHHAEVSDTSMVLTADTRTGLPRAGHRVVGALCTCTI